MVRVFCGQASFSSAHQHSFSGTHPCSFSCEGKKLYKNKSSDGRNNISGRNIKRLRKAMPKPNSQRAVASGVQLLGLDLDKNAIQRIESGERFVTDLELKVFANYFGVSTGELLEEVEMPEEDSGMTEESE